MVSKELKKLIKDQEMAEMQEFARVMTHQCRAAMEGDKQAIEWVRSWIRPWVNGQSHEVPFPVLLRVAAAYFVGADLNDATPAQRVDIAQNPSPIEPPDLPDELVAANVAYRTVAAGYGDTSDTFRNRLIHYLSKNWPGLGKEAVDRIATIANPDKSRGRKKINA